MTGSSSPTRWAITSSVKNCMCCVNKYIKLDLDANLWLSQTGHNTFLETRKEVFWSQRQAGHPVWDCIVTSLCLNWAYCLSWSKSSTRPPDRPGRRLPVPLPRPGCGQRLRPQRPDHHRDARHQKGDCTAAPRLPLHWDNEGKIRSLSYSDERYLQFDGNIFKGFFSKKTKEKFF